MIKKIENEFLSVEINERGAELFSIKGKKTGVEYLWQGDEKFWKDRSPVLFPICGRLFGGKYSYKDKEYEMLLHGIARSCDFKSKTVSLEEVEMVLNSTEKTKEIYPFDFELKIIYALENNQLKIKFAVENQGDNDLYFSFGWHPGFNVPFNKDENFEDYYIEFSSEKLNRYLFVNGGFITGEKKGYEFDNKKLHLKHSLFDEDIFFEIEKGKVQLKSKKSDNCLEIAFDDMTCLGLWHNDHSEAPFVCIEPWHGVPSTNGVIDDFATKQQMLKLNANEKYTNTCVITITEK